MDKLLEKVQKLHLEDGDILVLRDFSNSQIEGLMRSARLAGFKKNCPILLLHGDQTAETLTPEQMEERGWVRREIKQRAADVMKRYEARDDAEVSSAYYAAREILTGDTSYG